MNVTDSDTPTLRRNTHYNDNFQDKQFVNSMVFRVFVLLLLLGLLWFAVEKIESLFDHEINKRVSISEELSQQWGNEQTIIGPILSIPYVERISRIQSQTDSKGITSSVSKDIFNNKTLILLPENLRLNADLKDKVLTKDNIQANVYQGDIEITGNFNLESLPEASGYNTIEWDKAFIAIAVSENKTVKVSSPLRWEGSSSALTPGTRLPTLLKQGFHASLEEVANDNESPQFRIQLSLKGEKSFKFAPFGELTSATIKSNSSGISVNGDIAASSTVSSEGEFEASWRISNLVRNYPQQWLIDDGDKTDFNVDFSNVLTGVKLTPTESVLDKQFANIKLIIPFLVPMLGILFLSLLLLEFKRNTHSKPKLLHYIVISILVLSTPVLLFTVNQTTNFEQSYQIVAGTIILLIIFYLMFALRSFFKAFYMLLIITCLYGALYVKLQLPEYTLFAFSAAILFIIILLMMASVNLHEDE